MPQISSTIQEAILAEVLGDIGLIRTDIQQLRALLARLSGEIRAVVSEQASGLTASATRLVEESENIENRITDFVNESAQLSAAWAQENVRAAVRDVIWKDIGAAVQTIRSASEAHLKSAKQSEINILRAAEYLRLVRFWTSIALVSLAASLLTLAWHVVW